LRPAAAEPTRRLFFALRPAHAARHELALAARAACLASGGREVPQENLHLTLAFLGSVSQQRVPQLLQIGRDCAAALPGTAALAVRFRQLEHWSSPQVLVATATSESAAADRLAAALKAATAAAGFAPDLKSFRAHVTVARKVVRAPPRTLLRQVEWRCDTFVLMDSRSGTCGPVYSVVGFQTLVKTHKPHE
jgi:RNA 2',3'-cyclic 3'-phosphodiesterase